MIYFFNLVLLHKPIAPITLVIKLNLKKLNTNPNLIKT